MSATLLVRNTKPRYGFIASFLALTIAFPGAGIATARAGDSIPIFGEPKVVASGFIATEGPVWDPVSATLIFSDIPGNTIYSYDPATRQKKIWRASSNNANGLALDLSGHLLAAEQKTRTITRTDPATRIALPFIESFEHEGLQRKFNSPNDMVVHANGTVYFTDPSFGIRRDPQLRELPFNGVFTRRPDGTIEIVKRFASTVNPNGIVFNAQQTRLYLAVSDDTEAPIYVYDVDAGGILSNERVFGTGQNNDGMAVDSSGNLYVANRTGVKVFNPDGKTIDFIVLPGNLRTTNVVFGGTRNSTLFITNRGPDIYAVTVN